MRHFLLICLGLTGLLGCEQGIQSGCRSVSETVDVNKPSPNSIEPFSPDSARVFMFEYNFNEPISVLVNDNLIAQKQLEASTNGLAGRLLVKARPNDEIVLKTTNGCAHFNLKDGYKYLYITRINNKDWAIAYANYGRGYL